MPILWKEARMDALTTRLSKHRAKGSVRVVNRCAVCGEVFPCDSKRAFDRIMEVQQDRNAAIAEWNAALELARKRFDALLDLRVTIQNALGDLDTSFVAEGKAALEDAINDIDRATS